MPTRPKWLLDFHEDFPASRLVAAKLEDPLVIDWHEVLAGRWPTAQGPLVGYGTMRTMTRLARQPGLGLAVFDDYPQLRCSAYYRSLYPLLGRACVLAPFGAVPSLPLARMFGERVFLRSDTNYKLFPAKVLEVGEVPAWLETYREHADELVVLSEVFAIDREYRCVCRNGAFVCGSSYPDPPFLEVPDAVRRFAEDAAGRLLAQGPNLVTVDVAVTGEVPRLVEVGGVNSWGLYGADVAAFIAAMEAEALARHAEAS